MSIETRFPTLYHDIVRVRPAPGEKDYDAAGPEVVERRTPKTVAPTLRDVIVAVCGEHRVTDNMLINDLAATVGEFTAAALKPEKAPKPEKAK